jgi:hypothetical protein
MTAITKTSLRTLLGAAALASLVSALAPPASAALSDNGIELNGTRINGVHVNGTHLNGLIDNGVAVKGTSGEAVARPDGAFDFGSLTVVGVTPAAAR